MLSLRSETAEESWVGYMRKLSTTGGVTNQQNGGDVEERIIELNHLAKRRDILHQSEASSTLKNVEEGRLVSSRVPFNKTPKVFNVQFQRLFSVINIVII